ncbi:hypothetical protein FVE85_7383 [Porphyridium purpureum]|uniref:Uncharacterized protein n=1 Tax=Porphyridium purpureum TaxID=35688 RepID=A0A5J4Z9H7_PORPP|nr:hypothetical protein FVE85_7383 [Porphyridium purpureum]|eukprot:POR0780..scf295_1
MGLFSCFGKGKKDNDADGATNKATAVKSENASGAATNVISANAGGGDKNRDPKDVGSGKKDGADVRDPDLSNNVPVQAKNSENATSPHGNAQNASSSNPVNAELNVGNEAKESAADMSEAQRREAEYLAMEREQQKKLVIRVSKWVADAEQFKESWATLGTPIDDIHNLEDFSDDESRPAAKQSAGRSNSEDQTTMDKTQQSSNRIPSAAGPGSEELSGARKE